MIINKLNVHILSKYEQNVSKRLTYVVYSVIINTEHTFYIGEYKNEKRTKPRGRVGMHSSALFLYSGGAAVLFPSAAPVFMPF